jgi:hypothetical protein
VPGNGKVGGGDKGKRAHALGNPKQPENKSARQARRHKMMVIVPHVYTLRLL